MKGFRFVAGSLALFLGFGLMSLEAQTDPGESLPLPPATLLIEPQPLTDAIYPSPQPFSLDARAAQTAIDLLRRARFLLVEQERGPADILSVREVYAWFLEYDDFWPPGYRRRYDIYVNGQPLEWERTSVEWGGEMVNLQILFTYRNQYPPLGLEYRPD
jgi:hypothetical protein